MIEALRQMIAELIKVSPSVVTVYRRTLTDNGVGGMVELADSGVTITDNSLDLEDDGEFIRELGTEIGTKARMRISHSAAGVQGNQPTSAGLNTSLSMFVLTDYHAPLLEGDAIYDGAEYWRVGPVNPFLSGRKIYGTEAPLTRVSR